MRERELTRDDVAFILQLRSEGIKLINIAHYVYGMSYAQIQEKMKTWGDHEQIARNDRKRVKELTRDVVAFILELMSEGVKIGFIAHYVYGMSYAKIQERMRTWGVYE